MAVSDGALFIVVAQVALYIWTFHYSQQRLWKILGAAGMILIGWGAGTVEDTVPAFIFMGISWIIAGAKLFEVVSELVPTGNQ